jgi:L,D-transpeptidase catalytic domain
MSAAARLAPASPNGKTRYARARTVRPVRAGDPARRLGLTAAVAVAVALTAMIAAVLAARPTAADISGPAASSPTAAPARTTASLAWPTSPARAAGLAIAPIFATPAAPASPAAVSLVLTAADHHDCPAASTACVDLTRHISWLQAGGKVTFGPVQMEPGKPGGGHETPRGTFHVAWKAGPGYMSTTYHEAMPWATFFAVGGIAFHGGSLTAWSHGCVHLTDANAHYYNEHLPVGAEVVVF